MQFVLADPTDGSDVGGWLQTASLAWLVGVAVSGVVTVAVAVLSGLLVPAARTFGALVTLWLGSAAVSALALGGRLDGRAVLLAVACCGLAIGASVAPPWLSGSSIFVIGASYVWLHFIVLWSNYYSLGSKFTVAGRWEGERVLPVAPAGLPFPDEPASQLLSLVSTAAAGPSSGYYFYGLAGNPNLTGNYLAPFLAFMAAWALRRATRRPPTEDCKTSPRPRGLRGPRRVPPPCACRQNRADSRACLDRGGAVAHAEAVANRQDARCARDRPPYRRRRRAARTVRSPQTALVRSGLRVGVVVAGGAARTGVGEWAGKAAQHLRLAGHVGSCTQRVAAVVECWRPSWSHVLRASPGVPGLVRASFQ